jgi:hypothetical protein
MANEIISTKRKTKTTRKTPILIPRKHTKNGAVTKKSCLKK